MRISKENKTEYNKKCGLRLKECREAKGMTQKALAEIVGYTTQQISNYECGSRGLQNSAHLLAKVLDVPADYLLCITNYKSIDEQYIAEREEIITTDHLLVKLLKQMGMSTYVKVNSNGEIIEYNRYNTSILGGTNDKVIFNGHEIELMTFQYMLDDMQNQIEFIANKVGTYAERREYYIADEYAKESERKERNILNTLLEMEKNGDIVRINKNDVDTILN